MINKKKVSIKKLLSIFLLVTLYIILSISAKSETMKEYYPNGNIKLETTMKNGTLEGITKIYYDNRNIKNEMPFKNGKMEKPAKFYSHDGQLEREEYLNIEIEN